MSVNIEIRRTARKKSVAFEVRLPNTLVVSAPQRLSRAVVNRMAAERLAWAEARLAAIEADHTRFGLPKRFEGGETFLFRGETVPLVVIVAPDIRRARAELDNGRLSVSIMPCSEGDQTLLVQKAVLKWYKSAAQERLAESVSRWSPVVGAAPAAVRVRNQRRRWGSCSRDGVLNFNWRLVMMPDDVLDYVVVHELCHLIEPNHSVRYWDLVARVLPAHKQSRRWLRANAVLLEACAQSSA
jgi:predicted metal-dependent hydrolase